jgi:hypothetical protein
VDLLSQSVKLHGESVDLLCESGVLLQQVRLGLGQLVVMLGGRLLVGLVGPGLCLLGDDHERPGVERDGGEDQVQQDPGLGIERVAVPDPRDRRRDVVDSTVAERYRSGSSTGLTCGGCSSVATVSIRISPLDRSRCQIVSLACALRS